MQERSIRAPLWDQHYVLADNNERSALAAARTTSGKPHGQLRTSTTSSEALWQPSTTSFEPHGLLFMTVSLAHWIIPPKLAQHFFVFFLNFNANQLTRTRPKKGTSPLQGGAASHGSTRARSHAKSMGPGTLAAKPASYRTLCDLAPIPVIDKTRALYSAAV